MKRILLAAVGMIFLLGMSQIVSAQVSGTMYTLGDIYYYLMDGVTATEGEHSLEPPAGAAPGDIRFKTLTQIYQDAETEFDRCDATAADVAGGKVFFSVEAGNWGVQTGTAASRVSLLVTGQTESYYDGDDGSYQMGVAYDYTDNGDGTISDNATGLMWTKYGWPGSGNIRTLTWNAAIDWAEGLVLATYDDWRIPNIEELYSILVKDATLSAPFLNRTMFHSYLGFYWSSTQDPYWDDNALSVDFSNGDMSRKYKPHSTECHARAVRDGE